MIIVESILLILEKNMYNKMKYLTVMNGADHS